MSKPKKMSAAAARRHTAEVIAKAQRPTDLLPAPLEQVLAEFVPRKVSSGEWASVQPLLFEIMRRSHIRGRAAFKQHLSLVTLYLARLQREEHELTIAGTMQHALVERWCSVVLNGQLEDSTASTRRARLRALASDVNPGPTAPPRGRTIGKNAIKPPYDDREVASIIRLARTQPSPRIGQQLCAMVGLGLGAGLDSLDLRHSTTHHISDASDGIRVTVVGERPRVVIVRSRYEDLVREGLRDLCPGALLLGRNPDRQNITAHIVANAVTLGNALHIEQTRLRSTWLTELMCAPVPLAAILASSGLTSARSLVELLPHATERYNARGSQQEAL